MQSDRPQPNRNKVNWAIDLAIFVAFLVTTAPRFSGIAIHEWLSIAFGAAIVAHLLLHWQWIVQITRRLFAKVAWHSRLNYLLNWLLFLDMTVLIFTGLMVSESALPLFGLQMWHGGAWMRLHRLIADFSVFVIGLHLALHWSWIVKMAQRFVLGPFAPRRLAAAQALATAERKKVQR